MPQSFASGKWALGLCDRCGRQNKLKDLKWEIQNLQNTNQLMCPSCWDPDQPQYLIGRFPVNDPQAIRNPRVDQDNDRSLFGWSPVLGAGAYAVVNSVEVA